MQTRFSGLFGLSILTISTIAFGQVAAPAKIPTPQFQGDYFGEMGRAFSIIKSVDPKAREMVVQRENDGKIVHVPIRDDTELRFRDSWGELDDYFPGQRIMLFVYVDENHNWTYPRAVEDEIQVSASHGWFAAVTAVDLESHTYSTHREEKDKAGKVTKVVDRTFAFAPNAIVWKSQTPADISGLKPGDEVIQQQVERDGKLMAVEILDRKGDAAIRSKQEEKHHKDQESRGLVAYVNDVEVISGALSITVAWSGADQAAKLKPGDTITLTPTDGSAAFEAGIYAVEHIDVRQRLHLAINARIAARMTLGQSLRLFMPGTKPMEAKGK